jgi:hypothetical protein
MTEPIPIATTILGDPDQQSFVVGVPALPTGPVVTPTFNKAMMGPLVESILAFWPLWDSTASDIASDAMGLYNATLPSASSAEWASGGPYGNVVKSSIAGATMSLGPIVLSGGYSMERVYSISQPDVWIYETVVNDPVSNSKMTYLNGVLSSTSAFLITPLSLSNLLAWYNPISPAYISLQFARIWNRPLDAFEVTALYENPYSMFGMTQELLNEITTIVNFMKPIRSGWRFIFQ